MSCAMKARKANQCKKDKFRREGLAWVIGKLEILETMLPIDNPPPRGLDWIGLNCDLGEPV